MSSKIVVTCTNFWPNDFSHFLTLVKSKVFDTYTLPTLGKAMFFLHGKQERFFYSLSIISTKRKELNEISYIL